MEAFEIFQATFEMAGVGIAHVDGSGKWIRANNALQSLLGYEKDELFSKTFKEMTHPDDLAFDLKHANLLYKNQANSFSINKRYLKKDGNYIWCNLTASVVRNPDSSIKYFIAVIKDISKEKTAKEKLLHMNEKLQELVEIEANKRLENERMLIHQSRLATMGEMISNIAHQWRQPLNTLAIRIQDVPFAYENNEIDKSYVTEFKQQSMNLVQYMSQTIDDFRNFFKPDKEKKHFNVCESINKAILLVSDGLKASFINIKTEFAQNEIFISGYPNELSQVILNILTNAKDALKDSDKKNKLITIKAEIVENKAIFKIIDNAGGIENHILAKIFEPYFTTKHKSQGTGLGLYMSKMIIEQNMQGKLHAYNLDDGACFEIVFKADT